MREGPKSGAWWRALGLAASVAACLPAASAVWALARIFRARMAFPLDLEWMESSHLYHAFRIGHGMFLYGDPARGFATFPYPPLYWAILAAWGAVFGLDYASARALSIACFVGTCAILALAVVRRAPTRRVGVLFAAIALGGIAVSYPLAGASYDLARTDAMALFFPVLAAALAGDGKLGRARTWATAMALVATLYTKQTGVFFVAWLLAFAIARDVRSGARLVAITFGASAALLVVFCAATGGWFWTWLFDQAAHGMRPSEEWSVAFARFGIHAPFAIAIPYLVAELRRRGLLSAEGTKWTGMLVAGFVTAMVPFMKRGGWYNVLAPVFVLSWPVTFVLVADLCRGFLPRERAFRAIGWSSVVIGGAITALLGLDVAPLVPTAAQHDDAARARAFVRDLGGSVVVTFNPYLGMREGRWPVQPILQGYLDAKSAALHADYANALAQSGAEWIVAMDIPGPNDYRGAMQPVFEQVKEIEQPFPAIHGVRLSLWRRRR